MPVIYNSKKITPAPLFTLSKILQKTNDGHTVGKTYEIQLKGTLVAYKGSPRSGFTVNGGAYWTDDFWTGPDYPPDESIVHDKRLASILRKQDKLRQLFSVDGGLFEAQTPDGSQPNFKCNPRVININFQDNIWVDRCDYTVTLEADVIHGASDLNEADFSHNEKIESATESWELEEGDSPNTFRCSHQLSAKGKRFYETTGSLSMQSWEQARSYVLNHLGLGISSSFTINTSGMNIPVGYAGYNHARREIVDETEGSYSIVETFLLASGTAYEEYSIQDRSQTNKRRTVSIDGRVIGLYGGLHNYSQKYTNANNHWTNITSNLLLSRAQSYTSLSLNPNPNSFTVTRDIINGVISYTHEYDNRPSNLISGAIFESIEVIDIHPFDVIGIVPVLGRTNGPVLQNLSMKSERQRRLQINATMAAPSGTSSLITLYNLKPDTNNIISGLIPTAPQIYLREDQEQWDLQNSEYGRSISWIYEL